MSEKEEDANPCAPIGPTTILLYCASPTVTTFSVAIPSIVVLIVRAREALALYGGPIIIEPNIPAPEVIFKTV